MIILSTSAATRLEGLIVGIQVLRLEYYEMFKIRERLLEHKNQNRYAEEYGHHHISRRLMPCHIQYDRQQYVYLRRDVRGCGTRLLPVCDRRSDLS